MSSTRETVEECPACPSGDVQVDTDLAAGICQECGFVVDAKTPEVDQDGLQSEEKPLGEETDIPSKTDWQDEISIRDPTEETLVETIETADKYASDLLVAEKEQVRTAELVTEGWKRNFVHGRTPAATAAAALLAACREVERPIPVGAIARETDLSRSKIHTTYSALVDSLDLQIDSPQPEGYVPYLSKRLDVSGEESDRAIKLLANCENIGGNPVGIAAAAIYIATNSTSDGITYAEAADVAELTKETVWKRAQDLKNSG